MTNLQLTQHEPIHCSRSLHADLCHAIDDVLNGVLELLVVLRTQNLLDANGDCSGVCIYALPLHVGLPHVGWSRVVVRTEPIGCTKVSMLAAASTNGSLLLFLLTISTRLLLLSFCTIVDFHSIHCVECCGCEARRVGGKARYS